MSTPHEGLTHLDATTPFEQSNIALIGSDIDHQLHQLSGQSEPAWSEAGVGTKAGVWLWVVEDFKLRRAASGKLGQGGLLEGDSYIILRSVAPVESKPTELVHDIYFWLGSKTSQDEAGVAAYKTVELDELLGGRPTQHRETQGNETTSFLRLFEPHLLVAQGGHASGFNHVTPTTSASIRLPSPRLFEVTLPVSQGGPRRQARVQEVPFQASSVFQGDVYILDFGDRLVQWNGRNAHPLEKAKAAEVARFWCDSRDGRATLEVLDDGNRDTSFFLSLGVSQADLPYKFVARPAPPPQATLASPEAYDLRSDSPTSQPLSRDQLIPSSLLLILTPAPTPLHVWVGSEVAEKRTALVSAQRLVARLAQDGKVEGTRAMVRVVEGGEDAAFWRLVG